MPNRDASARAMKRVLASSRESLEKQALSSKASLFISTAMRMVKTSVNVMAQLPIDEFRATRQGTNWSLEKPWALRSRHYLAKGVAHDTLRLAPASSLPFPRRLRASIQSDLEKEGASLPRHPPNLAKLLKIPPAPAPAKGSAAAAAAAEAVRAVGAMDPPALADAAVVAEAEDRDDGEGTTPIGAEWFTLFAPASKSDMAVQRTAAGGASTSGDGLESLPAAAPGPGSRVLLYLHGGGYVMGSPSWPVYREFVTSLLLAIDAEIARRRKSAPSESNGIAHDESIVAPSSSEPSRAPLGVLSLDYRLAPEHLFPSAPEDALAAYTCLLDAGVRPEDIAIAGDSAGGNLALSLALAIDRVGAPVPGAVVAFSPWGDLSCAGHSHGELAEEDPVLPSAAIRAAARALVGRVTYPTAADAAVAVVGSGVVAAAEKAREAEKAVGSALPAPLGQAAEAVAHAFNDAVFADIEAAARADAADAAADADAVLDEEEQITRVLRHPVASPSWATGETLARMPSTLVLSGAREVLLSDSITPFEAVRAHVEALASGGAAGHDGKGATTAAAAAEGGHAAAAAAASEASDIKAEAVEREESGAVMSHAQAAEGSTGASSQASSSAAPGEGPSASTDGPVKYTGRYSNQCRSCGIPKPRLSFKPTLSPAPVPSSTPPHTTVQGAVHAAPASAPTAAAAAAAAAAAPAPAPPAQTKRLRMTPADLAALQTVTEGSEEPVAAPVEQAVDVPAAARGPGARGDARWELSVWPGMFHVFPLAPFLPESQAAVRRAAAFLVEQCHWDRQREADLNRDAVE